MNERQLDTHIVNKYYDIVDIYYSVVMNVHIR